MLSPHLRGHLLLYDTPPQPTYGPSAGLRLLWAVVVVELALDPQLAAVRWFQIPPPPLALYVLLRLGLVLGLVRLWAGLELSDIGFRSWRHWTTSEKSYLLQIVVLANVIFPVVLSVQLDRTLSHHSMSSVLVGGFLPYFVHGFGQEVIYRGVLQTELTRRWGAAPGIVVANVLYAFGPLHANYYAAEPSIAAPMFAAIFGIGLVFATIFHRSRNLWIVAVMHAIGNAYIVGSLGPTG